MKKLMLVRHAKSDWNEPGLRDFDRPLNKRGLANAPEMAKRLLKKDIIPQYWVSSPAVRAKTTAGLFTQTLGLASPVYHPSIYEASYPALLHVINMLPDEFDFVALTGHNPGISDLLYELTGEIYHMPTCAVAVIDIDVPSWQMVSADTGSISYYDYPKNQG